MKKKTYILLIVFLALFIVGCKDNNASEETHTQEHNITVENPSVDVQNDKDSLSSFYTNFVIKDNYKVYTITEKVENNDIAIPNWQPKSSMVIDTVDFVNDFDDKMSSNTYKRIDFLEKNLRPNGVSIEKYDKKEMFMGYKTPYIKEYTSASMFSSAGKERKRTYITGLWQYMIRNNNESIDKYDVVCMSINMYEGFYNFSNSTKVFIYGVPEDTFENNLNTENGRYKYPNISVILQKYHNEECRLDILGEIEITESGNYYMDFSEIIKKDEYKDIIIEMELTGEITDEYTYAWYGFAYKVANEQAYQDWKAENTDKFIY